MGYHKADIPKGVIGESSKIQEEYHEWIDAHNQNNPVLELVELTDLIGAISCYTEMKYNIPLDELVKMTKSTIESFKDGERK